MPHKYVELSESICHQVYTRGWYSFTTHDIFRIINSRNGYYQYSYTTLRKAIDHLISIKKVVVARTYGSSPYSFIYVPNVGAFDQTRRSENEQPF